MQAFPIDSRHPLFRLFGGLVEHAFTVRMGWAQPALSDYLTGLLARFVHMDGVLPLRNSSGRRLEEVAEMLVEAHFQEPLTFEQRRALIHRHVGDYTLFWTGVYPESLGRLRNSGRKDHFIDYISQGKRSYRLAAAAEKPEEPTEAEVLENIAERFEDCVYGLSLVRQEWESGAAGGAPGRLMR